MSRADDDLGDWQAAQHRDECLRQQQIDEILRAAGMRPLDAQEIRILAAETGMGETYRTAQTRN